MKGMVMDAPDYHRSVVEFLAQPENIEYVFDIAERFEQIKDCLHLKFWRTVHSMLYDRIIGQGRHWSIDSNDYQAQDCRVETCVALYPRPLGEARVLGLSLQQQKNGIALYGGICWSHALPVDQDPYAFAHSIPQVATLRTRLEESGYLDCTTWWLGAKTYNKTEVPAIPAAHLVSPLSTGVTPSMSGLTPASRLNRVGIMPKTASR
jgi:hypothetical protein